MPPKRKNKAKIATAKQKKAIQSRLMRISLKVDGYVYKNRPISAAEAAVYAAEVAGYQAQCSADARFMQVIEKLLRCLRSIISEQEHGSVDPFPTQSPQNEYRCESPVYSLPDEDRVAVTQHILANEQHMVTTDNSINDISKTGDEDLALEPDECVVNKTDARVTISDVPTQFEEKYDENIKNDKVVIEIIDLCEDGEGIDDQYSQQSVEMDMQRALSNLSIRDTDTMNVDMECSQSILNGFNVDVPNTDDQMVVGKEVFKKPPAKANILTPIAKIQQQQVPYVQAKENINDSSKSTEGNINTSKLSENNSVCQIVESNKDPIEVSSNKKAQIKRNNNKIKSDKKTETIKETKKRTKKQINTPVNKVHVKDVNNNSQCDINLVKHAALVNNKENISSNLQKEPIYKQLKNIQMNNEMPKVYNKCVVDDLSWIENIRFVREIASEEFDPKLCSVEDAFWNNCMLPPMFDEHDFTLF